MLESGDAASIGVGLSPAGVLADIYTAGTGEDYFTGEEVPGWMRAAVLVPGVSELRRTGRVADALRVSSDWGRNRLVKELHDQGFVLDRATRSGDGLLYRNAATGEEMRIMPRPAQRFRNDPPGKHESGYYYRYRDGPDQPWGPHTSIPDK